MIKQTTFSTARNCTSVSYDHSTGSIKNKKTQKKIICENNRYDSTPAKEAYSGVIENFGNTEDTDPYQIENQEIMDVTKRTNIQENKHDEISGFQEVMRQIPG